VVYLKLYDVVVHQHEEYRRQQGLPPFDYSANKEFTKMFVFRCKDIVPRHALNEEILCLFGQDLIDKQRRALKKLRRYKELVAASMYKRPALPNSQLQFMEYEGEVEDAGGPSDSEGCASEANAKLPENMPPSQSVHDTVDSMMACGQLEEEGAMRFQSSSQEVHGSEGRVYLGKRNPMKECILENQFWDKVKGKFREKYREEDVQVNIKEFKARLRMLFSSEKKTALRLDAVCEKLVRNNIRFSRQEVSQVIHQMCERCPEFCSVQAVQQEGEPVEFLRLATDRPQPALVLSQ
jgi:hypothetical protein